MRATRADSTRGRGDGVVLRAGMTVVEVLVVVALLVVISAMVMPSMSGWRDESVFESIKRELGGELSACRSRAMRDGVAQRVVVYADGRVIRMNWTGPTKVEESEGFAPPAEVVDVGVELMTLPMGYTLGPRKVEQEKDASEEAAASAVRGDARGDVGSEMDAVSAGLTLVLYLPDGTVSPSRGDWRLVVRRGGENAKPMFESRLRLDGWTGGAVWEAMPTGANAGEEPGTGNNPETEESETGASEAGASEQGGTG